MQPPRAHTRAEGEFAPKPRADYRVAGIAGCRSIAAIAREIAAISKKEKSIAIRAVSRCETTSEAT